MKKPPKGIEQRVAQAYAAGAKTRADFARFLLCDLATVTKYHNLGYLRLPGKLRTHEREWLKADPQRYTDCRAIARARPCSILEAYEVLRFGKTEGKNNV